MLSKRDAAPLASRIRVTSSRPRRRAVVRAGGWLPHWQGARAGRAIHRGAARRSLASACGAACARRPCASARGTSRRPSPSDRRLGASACALRPSDAPWPSASAPSPARGPSAVAPPFFGPSARAAVEVVTSATTSAVESAIETRRAIRPSEGCMHQGEPLTSNLGAALGGTSIRVDTSVRRPPMAAAKRRAGPIE